MQTKLHLKVKRHRLTNISVKAFFYVPARFTVLKIEPSDPRSNIVMVLLTEPLNVLFATGKLTAFFIV